MIAPSTYRISQVAGVLLSCLAHQRPPLHLRSAIFLFIWCASTRVRGMHSSVSSVVYPNMGPCYQHQLFLKSRIPIIPVVIARLSWMPRAFLLFWTSEYIQTKNKTLMAWKTWSERMDYGRLLLVLKMFLFFPSFAYTVPVYLCVVIVLNKIFVETR